MKEIPLTKGMVALVDDEDFDFLNQWKWHASKHYNNYYAARRPYPERKVIKMHSVILDVPTGYLPDHKNGNTLDNRRENLRICTFAESAHNTGISSRIKSSRFKGVYWSKDDKKWRSYIKANGKRLSLGFYHDEVLAALAYDEAATKYFGEFARLNLPHYTGLRGKDASKQPVEGSVVVLDDEERD
jgi:hypothetical protein